MGEILAAECIHILSKSVSNDTWLCFTGENFPTAKLLILP